MAAFDLSEVESILKEIDNTVLCASDTARAAVSAGNAAVTVASVSSSSAMLRALRDVLAFAMCFGTGCSVAPQSLLALPPAYAAVLLVRGFSAPTRV